LNNIFQRKIWNWFKRQKEILTPDDYKNGVELAFENSLVSVKLIDIYVIPDYADFIYDSVDGHLSHLHNVDFTQLQWIFEFVEASTYFPFNVKTTYRRYSSDRVCEIRELHMDQCTTIYGKSTGLEPYAVATITYPTAETFDNRPVVGFYLLTKIPSTGLNPWMPSDFDENTKDVFDKVETGIYNFFPIESQGRIKWQEWLNNEIPRTNNAQDFLRNHLMRRPLEQYFNASIEKYKPEWLDGISSIYRAEADGELNAEDWEFPNMNIAIPQPSVHSRFDTHPPDPLVFFNNDANHLQTYVELSGPYNKSIIEKLTVSSLTNILRFINNIIISNN